MVVTQCVLTPGAAVFFHLPSFQLPRPPQGSTGLRARVFAVFQHMSAIDEYMLHSDGELMWLFEGRAIGDGLRVEDDDVGEISGLQKAAMIELKIGRGQPRQTADSLFK